MMLVHLVALLLAGGGGTLLSRAQEPRERQQSSQSAGGPPELLLPGRPPRPACPPGFFRTGRNCYYLSAGLATWRDAQFHCKARNATLAGPDRKRRDKLLRKYLMHDQLIEPLERWVGGIFNWRLRQWEWAASGRPLKFDNFAEDRAPEDPLGMSCILLDPKRQYRWAWASCIQRKHFVCEVARPRKRRGQNQRASRPRGSKARAKGEPAEEQQPSTRKKALKSILKNSKKKQSSSLANFEDNQIWANGIRPGAMPPKETRQRVDKHNRRDKKKRIRDGKRRKADKSRFETKISTAPISDTPSNAHHRASPAQEYNTAQNDDNTVDRANSLEANRDDIKIPFDRNNSSQLDPARDFHQLFNSGDFVHEEVLLKM